MNVDNMKSQMRKGILEYCILLILYREPSYASDIIQRLKKAKLIIVEGTLYPLLTRLKNDEQLTYEWIESTQGPPRKYYRLTNQGELLLNELEKSWSDLTATVTHIKGTPEATQIVEVSALSETPETAKVARRTEATEVIPVEESQTNVAVKTTSAAASLAAESSDTALETLSATAVTTETTASPVSTEKPTN